ncbi:hypothetical protein I551_6314 [Mycobacterium ulcerans str. Harvey]|uniref:Uncharacterized protein n=1 Tax=Mycobacterium ulcerans str. Harvey TaxID=1299332 RepID=A0ABN0QRI0_MYCUL|nr:hypothetical protein I551_6314 [Mycobacterium ulcerans str. Harvey]
MMFAYHWVALSGLQQCSATTVRPGRSRCRRQHRPTSLPGS